MGVLVEKFGEHTYYLNTTWIFFGRACPKFVSTQEVPIQQQQIII